MNKICYGCGAKLQCEDPFLNGYIPKDKAEDAVYCQRCYKIMHYGQSSQSATPKDIKTIISSINLDHKFVIFLVDFLSINNIVMDIYKSIRKDKILLISKGDIIPKSIKTHSITEFIRNYYDINTDIKLISSFKNEGIESLLKYLKYKDIYESYIVGLSNSGKSTLINKIIEINNSNMHTITTSYIPNTTLDFIRMPINDDLLLIDSPGFIIPSINESNIIKKNNIKSFIKPKTFQMKVNEVLSLENMYLKFSNNTSVTLYMSNDLMVKKYYKDVESDAKIEANDNTDLIISGLGFINIKNKCSIELINIDTNLCEVRDSIFGGFNE